MDDSPFEPAQPVYPPDEGDRLDATKRRIRQLKTRKAAALGGAATLALVGVVAGLALTNPGTGGHRVEVVAGPGTSISATTVPQFTSTTSTTAPTTPSPATSTTTTIVPPPTSPTTSTTTSTTVAATTTTTLPPRTVTGQVFDASGQPVARAFVESAGGAYVVTGDQGRYSIECGVGALLAGSWAVPMSAQLYNSTTDATTPGPGYIFSGGATDLSHATTPRCGSVVNFHLPPGAGVTIHFTNPIPSGDPGPADNLYLPGLNDNPYFLDPPLNANNNQVVEQLGSGTLRIDGVATDFNCSGPGVTGSGAIWYISLRAGQSATVDCAFVQINS
jgi:hypothetical protein